MREEGREVSARKPYQKPQVRRVKLETVEATLGTGCYNPGVSLAQEVGCGKYGPCVAN